MAYGLVWCIVCVVIQSKCAGLRMAGRGGEFLLSLAGLVLMLPGIANAQSAPFTIQGPGINPSDFRITVFATNLNYPLGMARLSDGSLLVAVSQGQSFWSSTGQIIRLTDTNHDGIADGAGAVLFTGLSGGQSCLRMAGPRPGRSRSQAGQPCASKSDLQANQ